MAQYYLLNTVYAGSTPAVSASSPAPQPGLDVKFLAGKLIDTTVESTATINGIVASGGQLWPATDTTVAAAAAIAQARSKNRGVDERELDSIMLAAAAMSAGGHVSP